MAASMSSHQYYLWEHAVLLYKHFGWHASVELFSTISLSLKSPDDILRCNINRGLIYARLGDISSARKMLQDAVESAVPSIIARCALAEFEARQGNNRQARYWYGTCEELYNDALEADERYHFGYCPSRDTLTANIRALWTSNGIKDDQAKSSTGIERIPAQCIFLPYIKLDKAPIVDRPALKHSTSAPSLNQEHSRRAPKPRVDSGLAAVYEDVELEGKEIQPGPKLKGPVPRAPPKMPQKADRSKFEARDARVQSESMKELADFLKCAGPGGEKQYLVDHKYLLQLLGKTGMGMGNDKPQRSMSLYDALMDNDTKLVV